MFLDGKCSKKVIETQLSQRTFQLRENNAASSTERHKRLDLMSVSHEGIRASDRNQPFYTTRL